MTDTFIPFEKMTIECISEQDGGMLIAFDWDETDPDLSYWTSLSEHEQRSFVLAALMNRIKEQLDEAS